MKRASTTSFSTPGLPMRAFRFVVGILGAIISTIRYHPQSGWFDEGPPREQKDSLTYKKELEAFKLAEQVAKENWTMEEEHRVRRVRGIVDGEPNAIALQTEGALEDVDVPYEMSASVGVSDGSTCHVNLDLPEIEDVVNETTRRALKTGRVSEKKRKKSDVYADYSNVAVGLGFHVAGCTFTACPTVQIVNVATYTQRVSKRTGNLEDEYVYVIRVEREIFSGLNFERIDLVEGLQNFEHRIKRRATGHLDTIVRPEWTLDG